MTPGAARILIVDDDEDNRNLLQLVMSLEGFDAVMAESGEEALAMIAEQVPDLVLLDIMMPEMNGFEVIAELRRRYAPRHILVILVSALDDAKTRLLAREAGADDFFTKPIDRADLCVRIRKLLAPAADPSSRGERG
ncbi:MAG: response regulator [Polyangia bacterium]